LHRYRPYRFRSTTRVASIDDRAIRDGSCVDVGPSVLRNNINVGIHYRGSWLAGNGCVPIHNLMEDAVTAEITRSQIWQWILRPKGVLDDGRKVDATLVRKLIPADLAKVNADAAAVGEPHGTYDQAAKIFEEMSLTKDYPEFLTLRLYEAMD
jgi:malate synthase